MGKRKEPTDHPERKEVSFKSLKGLFIFILFTLVLTFPVRAQEITVSAAISLKEAFAELGKAFEVRQKGTRVQFNFGASGDLVRQILAGAPVDVFASAGPKEMDELEWKGFTFPGTRVNFAGNTVVLAVPTTATYRLEKFPDLTRPEVEKNRHRQPGDRPRRKICRTGFKKTESLGPVKRQIDFC